MKNYILLFFLLFISTITLQAQEITHFVTPWKSAYYEDGESVDMKYINSIMKADPVIEEQWKKYKRNRNVSIVTGIVNVGFSIWVLSDLINTERTSSELSLTPTIGLFVSLIPNLIFQFRTLKFHREAIHSYNRTFDAAKTSYISPSREGLGIALNF